MIDPCLIMSQPIPPNIYQIMAASVTLPRA